MTEKEREASSIDLEVVAATEGELREARAELETLKARHEVLKSNLEKAQHESTTNLVLVKRNHMIVKDLKVEKFELLRGKDLLITDVVASMVEMEKWEACLKDDVFLENTFHAHSDFDGFDKNLRDAGFKFLTDGIKDIAPDLDLETLKLRYTKK